jgi:hypothetical protein
MIVTQMPPRVLNMVHILWYSDRHFLTAGPLSIVIILPDFSDL